ncbi:hypothetical protein PV326_012272 [Microctonus aethiopoides]|nr:hypothetical protein PV326_012272 [Microctonus aethiopoides]
MDCAVDNTLSEKVILVLGNNRLEANKNKLTASSLYFASLFSENFSDHRKNEYPINYEISISTLKDFVNWAEHTEDNQNDKINHYIVEPSLEKYTNKNDTDPLELLELSVVFMCEKLTNALTSIIILHWLYAEKIIEIWLMAEELGLEKLRDVALGACLDRFEELPLSSVAELSLENLMKLIGNINISSSPNWLKFIAKEGIRNYRSTADHDLSNHLYKSLLKIAELPSNSCSSAIKNRQNLVPCVVAQKIVNSTREKLPCVYWWRKKNFSELVDLKDIVDLMDNGKEVFGRQIIGRGFSIYVIGGEQGLGSGRFNKTIWRYCLLSKTWFSIAQLPCPRRHMAVKFIKNRLYLIGGVGHHRLKLSSVDVLDIHTGLWSKAAEIPEMFTEVPASCVVDGKIIYHKTNFYVFDPKINRWDTVKLITPDYFGPYHVESLMGSNNNTCCNDNNIYISAIDHDAKESTVLSRFSLDSIKNVRREKIHEWTKTIFRQIFTGSKLISFLYNDGEVTIEEGMLKNINTYKSIRTYTHPMKNIHETGFEQRLGCFNVIDPDTLHEQISFFDQESIDV